MNVFTFTTDRVCEEAGCKTPSVDLDWERKLIVHYSIEGSSKQWKWREALEVNTWYDIEIRQLKTRKKVD